MADIGTASLGTAGDVLHEPGLRGEIESEAEEFGDFEEIWDDILTSMDELRLDSDPDRRLTPENIIKAYAANLAFPDEVSVSRKRYSEERDLDEHVREHFKTLIDNRDTLRSSLGWSEDELLDACVLVYIDDAVFRFVTETRFEPKDDDLGIARFHRFPDELTADLNRWMEKVEIWWTSVAADRDIDSTAKELFNELHDSKEDFISGAKEVDVFLPISTNRVIDHTSKRSNLKRRIRRGSPSEKRIHEYCYSVVESLN